MLMRKRPLRGEKYNHAGDDVVFLEILNEGKGDNCSVLSSNGKMKTISLNDLDLPMIDTKNYMKLKEKLR